MKMNRKNALELLAIIKAASDDCLRRESAAVLRRLLTLHLAELDADVFMEDEGESECAMLVKALLAVESERGVEEAGAHNHKAMTKALARVEEAGRYAAMEVLDVMENYDLLPSIDTLKKGM
jgi:hypothetical protein